MTDPLTRMKTTMLLTWQKWQIQPTGTTSSIWSADHTAPWHQSCLESSLQIRIRIRIKFGFRCLVQLVDTSSVLPGIQPAYQIQNQTQDHICRSLVCLSIKHVTLSRVRYIHSPATGCKLNHCCVGSSVRCLCVR